MTAASEESTLRCGRFLVPLARPLIMGVVNITPDSFSDGGAFFSREHAIGHARRLVEEGAHIIDVGGESTRPGSGSVPLDEELRRILPVLRDIATLGVPISIDTSKAEVMQAALACGVDMVNDINAFRAEGALEAVASSNAAICIMHMRGVPRTMQTDPHYDDVVSEVGGYLRDRALDAASRGIAHDRIVIDPGFGFGKNADHNMRLLADLGKIAALGWPVLAGLSRKSTLGKITGRPVEERVHASVAAALLAVLNGAKIVRVHDVGATRDALLVLEAMQSAGE